MKILVSLSFLLVFSLPIIAHNETNIGSDIKRENTINNGEIENYWDEFYELNYDVNISL
tara:strand:+ start:372 stop:548 length:177 start_codon:yes stop_codon:yes gene_type:complete